MTSERREQINSVFVAAYDLPPEERELYLNKACQGDEELRARVEDLLVADHKNIRDKMEDAERLVHENILSSYSKGRYKIESPIERGGGGHVYLAIDTTLGDKKVAIKFLAARFGSGAEQLSRFKQEALAAVAVRHPNIIDVFDLVTDSPIAFIITEYVEGETVQNKISNGRLQVTEALYIAEKVAAALEAAHQRGIIHRDIKPANIMTGDNGVVKVLDFGIAKQTRIDSSVDKEAPTKILILTIAGDVFGTPNYMSPEQVNGVVVDARSDIWSLGVVLYEMLTGQAPFHGETVIAICDALRHDAPKPLSEFSQHIPDALEKIVDRALVKDRDGRYQRASDLRAELQGLQRRISAGKGTIAVQDLLPRADAPLSEPGPPVAMKAFSAALAAGQRPASFDLGTIWGLDRSSFIGIVSGYPGDETFEGLLRAERSLSDALKMTGGTKRLPTRWWLKVDARRKANGPSSPEEVWESLVNENDPRIHYLNDKGLPDSIIPGLYFDISSADVDEGRSRAIQNWCTELVRGKIKLVQLSVVLHVAGVNVDESRQVASRLLSELKELQPYVPVEGMTLTFEPHNSDLNSESDAYIGRLLGIGPEKKPGYCFCSWVIRAFKNAGSELKDEEEQRYGRVIAQARLCADLTSLDDPDGTGDARQVVQDLDEVAADAAQEFHHQFLFLIKKYLPGRIRALVKAYARSQSRAARRASLIFAAQSESDSLLDAWVESNNLEPGRVPEGRDLIADPSSGPFVEDLILALLRQYRRGQNEQRIKDFIHQQKGTLHPDLNEVIELCAGELSPDEFTSNFSVRRFLLAIRAGAEIKLPIERLRLFDLSEPDSWWLLEGLQPSSDRLGRILKLPQKQGAVFGLCSPEEWRLVSSDTEVERQVLTCRRRRPVKFLHC